MSSLPLEDSRSNYEPYCNFLGNVNTSGMPLSMRTWLNVCKNMEFRILLSISSQHELTPLSQCDPFRSGGSGHGELRAQHPTVGDNGFWLSPPEEFDLSVNC